MSAHKTGSSTTAPNIYSAVFNPDFPKSSNLSNDLLWYCVWAAGASVCFMGRIGGGPAPNSLLTPSNLAGSLLAGKAIEVVGKQISARVADYLHGREENKESSQAISELDKQVKQDERAIECETAQKKISQHLKEAKGAAKGSKEAKLAVVILAQSIIRDIRTYEKDKIGLENAVNSVKGEVRKAEKAKEKIIDLFNKTFEKARAAKSEIGKLEKKLEATSKTEDRIKLKNKIQVERKIKEISLSVYNKIKSEKAVEEAEKAVEEAEKVGKEVEAIKASVIKEVEAKKAKEGNKKGWLNRAKGIVSWNAKVDKKNSEKKPQTPKPKEDNAENTQSNNNGKKAEIQAMKPVKGKTGLKRVVIPIWNIFTGSKLSEDRKKSEKIKVEAAQNSRSSTDKAVEEIEKVVEKSVKDVKTISKDAMSIREGAIKAAEVAESKTKEAEALKDEKEAQKKAKEAALKAQEVREAAKKVEVKVKAAIDIFNNTTAETQKVLKNVQNQNAQAKERIERIIERSERIKRIKAWLDEIRSEVAKVKNAADTINKALKSVNGNVG